MIISNVSNSISIRIKPTSLKINAGLSTLCAKNNLIPNKVLGEMENLVKQNPQVKSFKRVYFVLVLDPSAPNGFRITLDKEPLSESLRPIFEKRLNASNLKEELTILANELYPQDPTGGFKILEGGYKSFQEKDLNKTKI